MGGHGRNTWDNQINLGRMGRRKPREGRTIMNKFFITWWIAAIVVMFLILLGFTQFADAHEGHGFTHMEGASGPILGSRYCPGTLTQLWSIDMDGDGATDKCTLIFFNHEKIHVRDLPKNEEGRCACPTSGEGD